MVDRISVPSDLASLRTVIRVALIQAMKLKLSDFKDTCLRHILQVIPGCYILRCYHGNKITKGTLQNLTQ